MVRKETCPVCRDNKGHSGGIETESEELVPVSRLQGCRIPRARDPGRRSTSVALIVGSSADKDDWRRTTRAGIRNGPLERGPFSCQPK